MQKPRPGGIVPSYMMASAILHNLAASGPDDDDDADAAVAEAVRRLTQGYTSTPSDDYLWSLWQTVLGKAVPQLADDPATRLDPFPSSPGLDRLVLLMKTLKGTDVKEISAWGDEARLWADLPLFGPQLRELWSKDPTLQRQEPSEEDARKWLVTMRFVSLLVKEQVQELDHLAIWSLRSALEEETAPGIVRDTRVSVAAMWLTDCGEMIWRKCKEGEEADKMQIRYTKPGKLYRGDAWFCRERWEFWAKALDGLASEGKLADATAAGARLAAEVMANAAK